MKNRELKICKVCKKEIMWKKGTSATIHNKRVYCSYYCMHKGRLTGLYRVCVECESPFYVKKAVSNAEKMGKYCSIQCYRKNKSFCLEKECLFCKGIYIVNKRAYAISKFCTKKCKDKFQNKGITPLDKLERARFTQTIQKKVLKRDDYTCQLCNHRGGNLQVDHIQSWAEYVELRFSLDNCRTLCMECHYRITWGKPMPKSIKTWGHGLPV